MTLRITAWTLLLSAFIALSTTYGNDAIVNNFTIDTSDREEVVASWKSIFLPTNSVDAEWTGDLTLGDAGTISPAFKQASLARLNWYRAMAGLHTDLEIDEAFSIKCQLAGLVMAANNALTHTLDPSWVYYSDAAAEAAFHGSIARADDFGTRIVSDSIEDSGSSNNGIDRRIDLFSEIADSYAIGLIPAGRGTRFPLLSYGVHTTNTGTAHAPAPPTRDEFIAWPSAGYFPYVPIPVRWSFHFSEAAEARYGDSIRLDEASIEVTCRGASVPVKIASRPKGRGGHLVFTLWGTDDATRHNAQTKSLLLGGGNATVPLQETPPTYDYLVPPGSTFDDITYRVKISKIRVNEKWEFNPSAPEGGPAGDGYFPSGGELKTVEYDVTFIDPDAPAAAAPPLITSQSGARTMESMSTQVSMLLAPLSSFSITQQPVSATINPGKSATLTVKTNATEQPITYQWYTGNPNGNSKTVSGAKSDSLKVSPTSTTTYWVQITSGGTSVDSQPATITIATPVKITKQPAASSVKKGDSVTVSVTATGDSPTYQWYSVSGKNNVAITGGTHSSVTLTPSTTMTVWVQVKNQVNSVKSASATISVVAPVSITKQPTQASIQKGKSTTLSVTASGDGLKYQWYTGNPGDTSKPISKAIAAKVTVSPGATTDYWVRVKNSVSSVDSAVATVSVVNPVKITKQPSAASVKKGDSVTLSVTASGDSPTYQWYYVSGKNNVAISGATHSSVTVNPTTKTNYWVEVKNSVNSVKSSSVSISVIVPVSITNQPTSASIVKGKSTTLKVSATGDSLKYQWYTGQPGDTSKPISKATGASVSVKPSKSTDYWVRVKNSVSSVDSAATTVTVVVPVSITKQPVAAKIVLGSSITLSVTATGDSPTYQWYYLSGKNNVAISGANGPSITVNPTSDTKYWVQVKNSGSSVNSATVTISVLKPATLTAISIPVSIAKGKSTTLTVSANGDALKYQWYQGATLDSAKAISKATSSSLKVTPKVTTTYWVEVKNSVSAFYSKTMVFVDEPIPYGTVYGGTLTLGATLTLGGDVFGGSLNGMITNPGNIVVGGTGVISSGATFNVNEGVLRFEIPVYNP